MQEKTEENAQARILIISASSAGFEAGNFAAISINDKPI